MKGPFTRLGQPARNRGGVIDPFELSKWFDKLWLILSGLPGISWDIIDKTGSKLSDIETRPHSDLQKVYGADTTDTGIIIEDAAHVKHVSNAQAAKWEAGANAAFQAAAELLMQAPSATAAATKLPSYDGLYLMGGF